MKTDYFPAGLNVGGRACLVIGNDREAAEKSDRLKKAGAAVTVVEPAKFDPKALTDQFLVVYCPLDNPKMTAQVAEVCRKKRILLCAIDQPAYCDVVNVAVYQRGALKIAIGTDGVSPSVAKKIREGLETSLKDIPIETFMDHLAKIRSDLEKNVADPKERREKLIKAVDGFKFRADISLPS